MAKTKSLSLGKKSPRIDFFIIICFFIFFNSFDYSLLNKNTIVSGWLNVIFLIIFTIILIIYISKTKLFKFKTTDNTAISLFAPLFFICFINIFYLNIFQISWHFENLESYNLVIIFVKVLIEEIIFRKIFWDNFDFKNKIIKLLVGSSLFSVIHLLNLINGNYIGVFVQVGYTFLIGFLMLIMYNFSNSLSLVVSFHLLYNLFNNELVKIPSEYYFSGNYFVYIFIICMLTVLYMLFVFIFSKNKINCKK